MSDKRKDKEMICEKCGESDCVVCVVMPGNGLLYRFYCDRCNEYWEEVKSERL